MFQKINYLFFLFIFIVPFGSEAQNIPPQPQPPRLVNDFAGLLSQREEQALELKLRYFNDSTSNQIAIVTVNSLDGYDAASYAFELGEKWGIGQADFNNGVVILVKPKKGNQDKGRAFIAVGYGLEPAIPDAIADRIVENEMIPQFRNDNFYGGLNNATTVLMKLAAGEITAEGYNKQTSRSPLVGFLPVIIILIVVLLMRSTRNRSDGVGRSSLPFWTALWLGSSMGRSHSGSWNNFSGGGSGFGGGGGSSFGGFGGGSFGGGGAGGSW
jgi:uncharacterized protein